MNNNRGKLSVFGGFVALIASALTSSSAVAQEVEGYASTDTAILEEIVVTATKRGSVSLADVPFSIQALTGDDLAKFGAIDFNDFYRQIPGLSVLDAAPGNKRMVIRGISGAGAGTVAVYLDEVVATGRNSDAEGGLQADVRLFDIDRVEVLKGPQGTTFGSSSLAGTVRYITNKPDTTKFGGRLFAGGRTTRGADSGGQFEGMVNLPLIDNKLAIRVAGFYQDQPGYIDGPLINQEGVDGVESFAIRGSLRYDATDALSFNFMAMIQETDIDGDALFHEIDLSGNPLGKFEQFNLARVPKFDDIDIYSATAEYKLGFGAIFGNWSHFKRDTDAATRDATPVMQTIGITPPGQPSIITSRKDRTRDTLELRFTSEWDSPFQLFTGVFYSDDEQPIDGLVQVTDAQGNEDLNGTIFFETFTLDTVEELAFFADVSFKFLDRFTATAGARYYDFDLTTTATAFVNFPGRPGTPPVQLSAKEDGVIWKFSLAYEITDDDILFFNVAEGFRPGGTNNPGICTPCTIPSQFSSDSLTSYEFGAKTNWLNNRLRINGAIYYIDWADIQMQQFAIPPAGSGLTGRFRFQGNGGGADVLGVEIDLTARLTDNLDLSLALNYSDAKLSEDVPGGAIGLKDDDLEYTPDFTFAGSADYTRPVGSLTGFAGVDLVYVSTQTSATSPLDPVFRKLDSYFLANLRAGLSNNKDWSFNVIASNLFDDNSIRTAYDVTALAPLSLISNRPRSIFFTVEKTFGGM